MLPYERRCSMNNAWLANGSLVIPGDILVDDVELIPESSKPLKVGPGVLPEPRTQPQRLIASCQGVVRYTPKLYVECHQRRYVPFLGDVVIGVVTERMTSDFYVVDMGAAVTSTLSIVAFEGATKRNRPYLNAGDVVYARVIKVPTPQRFCEVALSCMAPGSSKSWVTGETTFGRLMGGTLAHVSLPHARSLLQPSCVVLEDLGRYIAYEVAVGLNGRVWIRGQKPYDTILVWNAILSSAYKSPDETRQWVARMMKIMQRTWSV